MVDAFSSLSFTAPWILLAFLTLPILYWLLKISPPPPKRFVFPAIRLLNDETSFEQTPAKMPLLLLLLRLLLAALVILAMAGPLFHPLVLKEAVTSGPLIIILEDSWASAPDFSQRISAINARLVAARDAHRSCAFLLASEPATKPITLEPCDDVAARLAKVDPVAYLPEPFPLQQRLANFLDIQSAAHQASPQILLVADGIAKTHSERFIDWLDKIAAQTPVEALLPQRPILAIAGIGQAEIGQSEIGQAGGQSGQKKTGLMVALNRLAVAPDSAPQDNASADKPNNLEPASSGVLLAKDNHQQTIAEVPFRFNNAATAGAPALATTSVSFDLPLDVRNAIAQIMIANTPSAGAVYLTDSRTTLQRVGLVVSNSDDTQPLLSQRLYLANALADFADVVAPSGADERAITQILSTKPSAIILADVASLTPASETGLIQFLEHGGVVIRFAGAKLAAELGASDNLLPVRLRAGERRLGGALTWEKPKTIAPFAPQSPFYGLTIPADSAVRRQVLAEPDASLAAHTLAELQDGTPLVTAKHQGRGLIVLFHVSADANWSNLPLSGLFVAMLQRLVLLGSPVGGDALSDSERQQATNTDAKNLSSQNFSPQNLSPLASLSGYGVLGPPQNTAQALPTHYTGVADANHPPGLYGDPTANSVFAFNALTNQPPLQRANFAQGNIHTETLRDPGQRDLRALLLLLAFLCFVIDCVASFLLRFSGLSFIARGLAVFQRTSAFINTQRRAIFRGLMIFALISGFSGAAGAFLTPLAASAQTHDRDKDKDMALGVRLAYVPSGNSTLDSAVVSGLKSLSRRVNERTALTLAEPVSINPATDTLAFYPLLYWPVIADSPKPSEALVNNIANFMRNGGTVLFDTRDALQIATLGGDLPIQGGSETTTHTTQERVWLRQFLRLLDAPNLAPVPRDHVVTKTFYLLSNFVGRYSVGTAWIEALPPQDLNDTTPVPARAGDNVSPIIIVSNDLAAGWAENDSGQALYALDGSINRQHEFAIRGGINLVMYTLTGNYKADQVHAKDLLERLGR